MLVLGTQILLGFQFRSVFEPAFESLPRSSQTLKMFGLVILLVAIAFMMSPGSFHRIVRSGSDAEDVHSFATTVMDFALVPFALALVVDVYTSMGRILGMAGGVGVAALMGSTALLLWYGLGLIARPKEKMHTGKKSEETARAQPTSLKDKIDHALTEARVVLPGAQALLGFQFLTMFMEAFDKLPNSSKYIHMASLTLMALTMIVLMTPAAFHRIATSGEDTKRVHQVASACLLVAMIVLPLGIVGDVYIVFLKVFASEAIAFTVAIAVLLFFYSVWFGYTLYRRAQIRS